LGREPVAKLGNRYETTNTIPSRRRGRGNREDAKLVTYLRNALGSAYQLHYPKMPDEDNPDYKKWKTRINEELAALKGRVARGWWKR
jgi:hypothetical protein